MLRLKDEFPLWANVSQRLDRMFAGKKADNSAETCPSCGKTDVRVEVLETMSGLRMGFFTCLFCGETWSGPAK